MSSRSSTLLLLLSILTPAVPAQEGRVVRVGLHDAEPVAFADANGEPAGFGVEVFEHIADFEGWELEWREGTWSECLDWLRDGELDVLFPILRTEAREPLFDFTREPFFSTWGRIFVPGDSRIESVLDLDGVRIAIVRDDFFSDAIADLMLRLDQQVEWLPCDTRTDVFAALDAGLADAGAVEGLSGFRHLARFDVRPTQAVFAPGLVHMAVPAGRNADLLGVLDFHLSRLQNDEASAYWRAHARWYGNQATDTVPAWAKATLLVVTGVLLLALAFAAALRAQVRAKTAQLAHRAEALELEIEERQRADRRRREAETALLQSQKMEAVGQLAAGVAHDFRNLLTVLAAHLERIRERTPDQPAVAESLEVADQAVEQAGHMTRSLLAFSRRLEMHKRPVDLGAAVEDTSNMIRRALPASIQVEVDTDTDERPWIHADENQLRQVLLNLVLNARDAMPEGGTMRLAVEVGHADDDDAAVDALEPGAAADGGGRARAAQPVVRLRVSDDGVGMPPEVVERVFEPFYTTKERGRGTGLGLATVHGIVEEHGGHVSVASRPGAGSVFTVTLPRLVDVAEPVADATPAPAPAGQGETILLAEDDRQIRQIVAAALAGSGYDVAVARDGQEGLDLLEARGDEIQAAILDVDMPRRNGLEVLAALRARRADVPAIIMTGTAGERARAQADARTRVLPKPFRVADLGLLVRQLLDAPNGGPSP